MAIRYKENLIGAWSFFVGVVLAVIIGIFQAGTGTEVNWIYAVLAILGIFIGLMNIGDKDVDKFLLAAIALVIASYMGQSALKVASSVGLIMGTILLALLVMIIPATIIVAIKAVFSTSKG